MKNEGLIDSIEDNKGEEMVFLTKKGKSIKTKKIKDV
jgi:hypothetical protein